MKTFITLAALGFLNSISALNYNESEAYQEVKWAGAAYCCGTLGNGCEKWDCPSCSGEMETVVFENSKYQANGFVGYQPGTNTIVVSFAGTDPLKILDWIDDLDFVKTNFNGYDDIVVNCSGCEVHKGFYDTYMSVASDIRNAVDGFLYEHSTAQMIITGHSLGASLALHCAMDFTILDYPLKFLYNFGQPRTGNYDFSQYVTSMMNQRIFRITHHKDPVPEVPLQAMGFYHEPHEVFYNELSTDYTVCDDSGEDPKCEDQYDADLNIYDHLSYMNFDFTANYLACKF